MEAIHLKTVDPISQELLRSAAQRGIQLNWERHEKQQPQDGFQRLGLSCPYGCMQGPCRIDPFGRGADRGLCGLDRDAMVAAFLLRLCMRGALEALQHYLPEKVTPDRSMPASLNKMLSRAIKNLGGDCLAASEIHESGSLLSRPGEPVETLVEKALRLGLLTLALSERRRQAGRASVQSRCRVGYGILSAGEVCIGIAGQPSEGSLLSLEKEAFRKGSPAVQMVSLGSWVRGREGLLPFGCTSGEAELLLSTGKIHSLFAGPGTDPSLFELCRSLEIPSARSEEAVKPGELIRLARKRQSQSSRQALTFDPSLVGEGRVITGPQELGSILKKSAPQKIALVMGSDALLQPMGWLPVEVATHLMGEGFQVVGWGDAALWMVKNGLAADRRKPAVAVLDDDAWLALESLAAGNLMKGLRGICFTGLKTCRDLSVALGWASLGVRVCVSSPLPFWGSETVRTVLSRKVETVGGTFTHYDHPAEPQEILEWFNKY
jgi:hypothetical protein